MTGMQSGSLQYAMKWRNMSGIQAIPIQADFLAMS